MIEETNNKFTLDKYKMLKAENETLKAQVEEFRKALQKIADYDYRGSRSTESYIAVKALSHYKKAVGRTK